MLKVAILGANGFIGSRAVEIFHLSALAEVRPIVRTLSTLARLSRFDLDCRIADGFDEAALCSAFQDCDVVVHAIAGDRHTILGTLTPVYTAAQKAGVRRLVYLSSASVHGQSPPAGTDENSPLSDRQIIEYNNTKVRAERQLQQLRQMGSVELVMLRPGIVFGPRSYWITSFADSLLNGSAYLVGRGQGICNSIYVDNLVHAIYLSATVPAADREVFLVGDQAKVTWADLYAPIAKALGFDLDQIPEASDTLDSPSLSDRIESVLASRPSLAILSRFPDRWRIAARAGLESLFQPETLSLWRVPETALTPIPRATQEMILLQQCQYQFPDVKSRSQLGYQPPVSFQTACEYSIEWLKFSGYPVTASVSDFAKN